MKKILFLILILCWATFVNAQSLSAICIAPVCVPYKCITTDTVVLIFQSSASDGIKSMAITQKSGLPATIGQQTLSTVNGLTTVTAKAWGFAVGYYTFQATAISASGGISAPAIDSVVVSAPAVVIPPLKFIVTAIPLMDGKHFTIYSDGSYLLQ